MSNLPFPESGNNIFSGSLDAEPVASATVAVQRLKRVMPTPTVDEFGIPIATPSNQEPLMLGVRDELLGVFPESMVNAPVNLLPCPVSATLTKKIIQPEDASLVNQLMAKTFRFFGKVETSETMAINAGVAGLQPIHDLSRAYYTCQVPEVLFVHTVLPELERALIEDLAVYVEKLLNMGFISAETPANSLLAKSHNREDTAIHRAMPCIVMMGHGFLYQRFIRAFMERLSTLGHSQQERRQLQRLVLGRVCRGLIHHPVTQRSTSRSAMRDGVTTPDFDVPDITPMASKIKPSLRLAGGLTQTQRQIQHAMGRHQVIATLETESPNPAERLEIVGLHNALQRVILPYAYQQLSNKARKRPALEPIHVLRNQLQQALFKVGLERQAFSAYEVAANLPLPCDKNDMSVVSADRVEFIADEIRLVMGGLVDYATPLLGTEALTLLKTLDQTVQRI
jgi:hypothetical protein